MNEIIAIFLIVFMISASFALISLGIMILKETFWN